MSYMIVERSMPRSSLRGISAWLHTTKCCGFEKRTDQEKVMSNGYLLISEIDIDELQKNRYMKFEKLAGQYSFHVYVRMEYLSHKYKLIDFGLNNSFHLSKYGEEFFRNLKFRNEIYFSYFLLEKRRRLEGVAREACKNIELKTKKHILPLCKKNFFKVSLNEICYVSAGAV